MAVSEQFVLFLKFTQTHFSSSSAHPSKFFLPTHLLQPVSQGGALISAFEHTSLWVLRARRMMKRSFSGSPGHAIVLLVPALICHHLQLEPRIGTPAWPVPLSGINSSYGL
jgi:hypothetical protein